MDEFIRRQIERQSDGRDRLYGRDLKQWLNWI